MELGTLVAIAEFGAILLDTSCQRTEVFRGFGNGLHNIVRRCGLDTQNNILHRKAQRRLSKKGHR